MPSLDGRGQTADCITEGNLLPGIHYTDHLPTTTGEIVDNLVGSIADNFHFFFFQPSVCNGSGVVGSVNLEITFLFTSAYWDSCMHRLVI